MFLLCDVCGMCERGGSDGSLCGCDGRGGLSDSRGVRHVAFWGWVLTCTTLSLSLTHAGNNAL